MSGHGDSKRAIVAAFLANLGIAVMKFVAFLVTNSSAMLSEAIHSVADAGNQGLLLLGAKQGRRPPDDQHPFGYGGWRYFWAFVVAFVLFSLGGVFSLYEGIEKVRHPHEVESIGWAVGVLLGAIVLESLSFRTAIREARIERQPGESWWRFIRHSKSPELPVVLLEDLGALVGLFIALTGVALAQITDNAKWDGLASIGIGTLLVVIAVLLVIEMGSLLVGESARPEVIARIRSAIEGAPNVRRVIHLRTEHVGPDDIIIAAKLDFDHDLSFADLARAIDDVEARIRAVEPRGRMVFIEPDVYREPAAETT